MVVVDVFATLLTVCLWPVVVRLLATGLLAIGRVIHLAIVWPCASIRGCVITDSSRSIQSRLEFVESIREQFVDAIPNEFVECLRPCGFGSSLTLPSSSWAVAGEIRAQRLPHRFAFRNLEGLELLDEGIVGAERDLAHLRVIISVDTPPISIILPFRLTAASFSVENNNSYVIQSGYVEVQPPLAQTGRAVDCRSTCPPFKSGRADFL